MRDRSADRPDARAAFGRLCIQRCRSDRKRGAPATNGGGHGPRHARINGVEATREICKCRAAPVVVAFSRSRELWHEARAAGASYTLLKDEDPQTLVETIRTAARR